MREISNSIEFSDNFVSHYSLPENYSPRQKYPTVILIGHPMDAVKGKVFSRIESILNKIPENYLLIRTGILDTELDGRDAEYQPDWQMATRRMNMAMERYLKELPIDPQQIVLTGHSFDAVYAWMLAYDRPELYAGVVSLGGSVYPEIIQKNSIKPSHLTIVCCWGEEDAAMAKENGGWDLVEQCCTTLCDLNPKSRFIIEKGETHGSITKNWGNYLKMAFENPMD